MTPNHGKKKKLRKMSRLHDEARDTFNLYIRRRDADKFGYNICVTCKGRFHYMDMNAGHYYHGKHWMSAMDERNVWPQCVTCNNYKHGNLIEYSVFLIDKFGRDIIDTLRELRHMGWKPSRQDLTDLIHLYKGKLEALNGTI